MKSRRFVKPLVAALLASGLVVGGVAPAVTATTASGRGHANHATDTGWGFASGKVSYGKSSPANSPHDTGWGFA